MPLASEDSGSRLTGFVPTTAVLRNVRDDSKFAEATRIIHTNTNPFNAVALVQFHDRQAVVQTPPALPLSHEEMDAIFDLPYTRRPHPSYTEPIPAHEMIKDSVTIMRGCFGGCTFCSITGASGTHHPESFAGIGLEGGPQARGRPGVQGSGVGHRRRHREHVRDALFAAGGRGEVQAAVVRPSDDLQAARHRSRPAGRTHARRAQGGGHPQGARLFRHPHGPGATVARVRARSRRASHRRVG